MSLNIRFYLLLLYDMIINWRNTLYLYRRGIVGYQSPSYSVADGRGGEVSLGLEPFIPRCRLFNNGPKAGPPCTPFAWRLNKLAPPFKFMHPPLILHWVRVSLIYRVRILWAYTTIYRLRSVIMRSHLRQVVLGQTCIYHLSTHYTIWFPTFYHIYDMVSQPHSPLPKPMWLFRRRCRRVILVYERTLSEDDKCLVQINVHILVLHLTGWTFGVGPFFIPVDSCHTLEIEAYTWKKYEPNDCICDTSIDSINIERENN